MIEQGGRMQSIDGKMVELKRAEPRGGRGGAKGGGRKGGAPYQGSHGGKGYQSALPALRPPPNFGGQTYQQGGYPQGGVGYIVPSRTYPYGGNSEINGMYGPDSNYQGLYSHEATRGHGRQGGAENPQEMGYGYGQDGAAYFLPPSSYGYGQGGAVVAAAYHRPVQGVLRGFGGGVVSGAEAALPDASATESHPTSSAVRSVSDALGEEGSLKDVHLAATIDAVPTREEPNDLAHGNQPSVQYPGFAPSSFKAEESEGLTLSTESNEPKLS